jgi:hypothetical protein
MKRRTLRQLRPKRQPTDHHGVNFVVINSGGGKFLHEDVVYDHQKP